MAITNLAAFARSLGPEDHVMLESTSVSWALVDVLARHAGRVTVSNPMKTKAIASAKVKSDKVDARVLAQLGAAEFVAEVWVPDTKTRELRRRVAHRAGLVRQRTAVRNQVHGVLARNLVCLPAFTDLFGRRGRQALKRVRLAAHEREQIDSALRLHDALQREIDRVDGELARWALGRDDVRRLMTIPGVGAATALSLVAVMGDWRRFGSPRQLVGYLGSGSPCVSVRRTAATDGTHFPPRPSPRAWDAGRGGAYRCAHAWAAARVLPASLRAPWHAGRDCHHRPQARRTCLAHAQPG
ncbi:MAG: IS110 family transposase [Solirubrobacterales bacterium]|nr:IS110 family transposase [Solirubrobacterales bacterium]MBV9535331.1 IS110 family transposase [Solirubrobacterales bacterium]